MRKIGFIIWREYITRVSTKSFLFTTLLAPLLFLGLPIVTILLTKSSSDSIKQIAIEDKSGLFKDIPFADKEDGSLYFKKTNSENISNTSFKTSVYDGLIVIPSNFDLKNSGRTPITFISKKRAGIGVRDYIDKTINKAVLKLRFQHFAQNSMTDIDFEKEITINYERFESGDDKSAFVNLASVIGYLTGMLIYITITIYGTMILRGVMEEKTNRVMEVLISSVKPFQLMFGKIIGVGAVGLTQFSVWIALLFIGNLFLAPLLLLIGVDANGLSGAPSGMNSPVDQSEMQAMMMSLKDVHFGWIGMGVLVYFLLGFFLYGTMFAAVGAVGNDETNAQSLTLPIMLPIIIAFMMMITALNDPEGKVAFWGSIIPFTSPVIMPALLAYQPPFWQIGLSVFLLILTFILITYFAGKIYRIGVLMYGKKISFKEIFHWLIQ